MLQAHFYLNAAANYHYVYWVHERPEDIDEKCLKARPKGGCSNCSVKC